jgi:hypothetical protein
MDTTYSVLCKFLFCGRDGTEALFARPFEVERQQAGERVLGRNILRPAIRRGHGSVERVMGVGEPARTLVIEVGRRALFELEGGPRSEGVAALQRCALRQPQV